MLLRFVHSAASTGHQTYRYYTLEHLHHVENNAMYEKILVQYFPYLLIVTQE
jgi:hypothetical protein